MKDSLPFHYFSCFDSSVSFESNSHKAYRSLQAGEVSVPEAWVQFESWQMMLMQVFLPVGVLSEKHKASWWYVNVWNMYVCVCVTFCKNIMIIIWPCQQGSDKIVFDV